MLEQLLRVSDDPDHRNRLYPILLERAGRPCTAHGLVTLLAEAICAHTEGLPEAARDALYTRVPDFVDALLPEDAAEEAKCIFQAGLEHASK